ncbi:MAG: GNAT family N-acetyltransferase [Parvularculaceae bacterium]
MRRRAAVGLAFEVRRGGAIASAIDAVAALRIEVFRDYPYLYDGDAAYERDYLRKFAEADESLAVLALDGDRVVGCATASALGGQHEAFVAPLRAAGYDIGRLFYFGESVLRAAYRGQGAGHVFFDEREAAARAGGFAATCFCAVERPDDHPLRPVDHRSLEPFWRARGYERIEGPVARFEWRDVDQPAPDEKPMAYWMRAF